MKNPIRIRIAIATGNTTQSAQNIVITKTMSAVMISALIFLFIAMLFSEAICIDYLFVNIHELRQKMKTKSQAPALKRTYMIYI